MVAAGGIYLAVAEIVLGAMTIIIVAAADSISEALAAVMAAAAAQAVTGKSLLTSLMLPTFM
jgi:hypothetical protein